MGPTGLREKYALLYRLKAEIWKRPDRHALQRDDHEVVDLPLGLVEVGRGNDAVDGERDRV